jgi:hypothetical protein
VPSPAPPPQRRSVPPQVANGGGLGIPGLPANVPTWVVLVSMLLGTPLAGLVGGQVAGSQYVTREDMDRLSAKVDTLDAKITELRIAIALATKNDPGGG